jgi:hypothetical protein
MVKVLNISCQHYTCLKRVEEGHEKVLGVFTISRPLAKIIDGPSSEILVIFY